MKNAWWLTVALTLLGVGCSGEDCKPNDKTICTQGEVFWVDSCGNQGDPAGTCECGCDAEFSGCREPCECTPDCDGLECGPDGCGDSCPPGCASGQNCIQGTCQGPCVPDCETKCCSSDGCGGICLDRCALTSQSCNLSSCLCEGSCTPECDGRECGPDGCGADCGSCGANFTCQDGHCQCPNAPCDQACCAPGEVCHEDACCLADCAGLECGTNCAGVSCGLCAQGFFCSLEQHTCIYEGVEDCWSGSLCPPDTPNCFMSCETMENKCCSIVPDHPLTMDGSLVDTCEVCCVNEDYPNPVLWPDGNASCCATPSPYPYHSCEQDQHMCCPVVAGQPNRCDGTVETSCRACCGVGYVAVLFPDGHTSCCPESNPWPCLNAGNNGCCEEPGQCGKSQ